MCLVSFHVHRGKGALDLLSTMLVGNSQTINHYGIFDPTEPTTLSSLLIVLVVLS